MYHINKKKIFVKNNTIKDNIINDLKQKENILKKHWNNVYKMLNNHYYIIKQINQQLYHLIQNFDKLLQYCKYENVNLLENSIYEIIQYPIYRKLILSEYTYATWVTYWLNLKHVLQIFKN